MKSIRSVNRFGTIRYTNEKGEFHRIDGPAYETTDGYREWFRNGKRHREDGPARIWPDGEEDYFIYNIGYSKEDWEQEVVKLKLGRLLDL